MEGATHYRPSTEQHLKLEEGAWYLEVNDSWQRILNPFKVVMVKLNSDIE